MGYIGFPYEKTYLAESRRIPLRRTESEGLIAPNYNRLLIEKPAVIWLADCFNYLHINIAKIQLLAMRKNKIWLKIVDISIRDT